MQATPIRLPILVFVSSRIENMRLEREFVERVCRRLNMGVIEYPERGLFGELDSPYMEGVERADIVVHLIYEDSKAVAAELARARELGKPVMPLAKVPRTKEGWEFTPFVSEQIRNANRQIVTFSSLGELESALVQGLGRFLKSRFDDLRFKPWSDRVYTETLSEIHRTRDRFGLAQKTSTLLLGPLRQRVAQERPFYDRVRSFIDSECSTERPAGRHPVFLHVFDKETTLRLLRGQSVSAGSRMESLADYENPQGALDYVRRNAERWERECRDQVVVRASERPITAAVVFDHSFEVATVFGERHYVWMKDFGEGARSLWDALENVGRAGQPLTEFLEEVSK